MKTKCCLLLLAACVGCGCTRTDYSCRFADGRQDWPGCERVGPSGERVEIEACFATEISGSHGGGPHGFNCIQVVVYPPQNLTAAVNVDRTYLAYGDTRIPLVFNEKLLGKPFLQADAPNNALRTALYQATAEVFPTGEGVLHLSLRVGETDSDTAVPFRITEETVDDNFSLPISGH